MPSKKQKITGPKVQVSPFAQLQSVEAKFKRLQTLRKEINRLKALYQEHDSLMEELMPVFIEQTPDVFIVHREVRIGRNKHRVTPFFYDEKKDKLVSKVWKSSAFQSVAVE